MSEPSSPQTRADLETGLEADEIRRYGRHLVLPEVGMEGQARLKAARVLIVGVGGLGSPAALYLAAAGVGTLGLVDFDRVDLSNLQRQVLYGVSDVEQPKVEAAAARLQQANPHVDVRRHETKLERDNVLRLLADYDLVLDGSDNAATRYLVNDACLLAGKPLVWGAVLRFQGQVSVFGVPGGPCYRCLFPDPPPPGTVPSCAEGGVLGVLPGVIGTLQANEAIKLILGVGDPLVGRFVTFDALRFRFHELALPQDPACPSCSDLDGLGLPTADEIESCALQIPPIDPVIPTDTEEKSMTADPQIPFEIDVHQLNAWREQGVEHELIDVREPQELQICGIEGAELIPMGDVPHRIKDLDADRLFVVHCHHGGRSAQVVQYMRANGFGRVTNLAGGIEAWSLEIDPAVPRY